MGLGEGVAPSASTDMLARLVDTSQRSRATSYMFGGLHVGSLLGLLVAPPLIETFGWQTVWPPHTMQQHMHIPCNDRMSGICADLILLRHWRPTCCSGRVSACVQEGHISTPALRLH